MGNALDKDKKYRRLAEPFSANHDEAWAQLAAMRPRLRAYFQRKNVPTTHNQELVDETIEKVMERYYAGGELIEHPTAYTYAVAKSVLRKYLEGPGGHEGPMPDFEVLPAGAGRYDKID